MTLKYNTSSLSDNEGCCCVTLHVIPADLHIAPPTGHTAIDQVSKDLSDKDELIIEMLI